MARNSTYKNMETLKTGRNSFDLSYDKLFSADMGFLYPVMARRAVPGDKWHITAEMLIRMNPLVSPVITPINAFVHTFFVPNRLIDDKFEDFIKKGDTGDLEIALPLVQMWNKSGGEPKPSFYDFAEFDSISTNFANPASGDQIYGTTLHDILYNKRRIGSWSENTAPTAEKLRAYKFIWNEYYRDQNLQSPYAFLEKHESPKYNREPINVLRRNWEKDRFTASLPFQQRGTSPSLPITGLTHADFTGLVESNALFPITDPSGISTTQFMNQSGTLGNLRGGNPNSGGSVPVGINAGINAAQLSSNNVVDLEEATTLNMNALRQAMALQKWMERNARGGTRYTEILKRHHNVAPTDSRLDRPEYIGGVRCPIVISEVLQTSESNVSKQGNMAGHGISVLRKKQGSYFVEEYGWIISLLSIMPRLSYANDHTNREDSYRVAEEFYWREFANLSEQAVTRKELILQTPAGVSPELNDAVHGFVGIYDELRTSESTVHGLFRDTSFASWHLGRVLPTNVALNSAFIECNPDKRIFAVPTQPGFIVNYGANIVVSRQLPFIAEPGLIDHF